MKKYLVLYHAPADAMQQMGNASPEEQEKGMQAWMQWANQTGKNLVDLGAPLMNGQSVGVGGNASPSNKDVSGYSILEAENMDDARAKLNGHPHLAGWSPDATIELHEVMPIPGM